MMYKQRKFESNIPRSLLRAPSNVVSKGGEHPLAIAMQGKKIANPTAMILAAVMMLDHVGEPRAAKRVGKALETVLLKGERLTPDLNGRSSTTQFADAIVREIER